MDQLSQQPTPQPIPSKKKFYKRWWFWGIIVLILIATLFVTNTVGLNEYTNLICKVQGKKQFNQCNSLGCDPSLNCLTVVSDANKLCIQNNQCSTGICLPPLVGFEFRETFISDPYSLASLDGVHFDGKCMEYVGQSSTGMSEPISIQGALNEIDVENMRELNVQLKLERLF